MLEKVTIANESSARPPKCCVRPRVAPRLAHFRLQHFAQVREPIATADAMAGELVSEPTSSCLSISAANILTHTKSRAQETYCITLPPQSTRLILTAVTSVCVCVCAISSPSSSGSSGRELRPSKLAHEFNSHHFLPVDGQQQQQQQIVRALQFARRLPFALTSLHSLPIGYKSSAA